MLKNVVGLLGLVMLAGGCEPDSARDVDLSQRTIRVVATTSMIAEMIREIGGDRVEVSGLMGPGVDPHLYKASEGDVARMAQADVVFYNGLHLEGKMAEIFEQMGTLGVYTFEVAAAVPEDSLLESDYFTGNYDPHIWFDAGLWRLAASSAADYLTALDSTSASAYRERAEAYAASVEDAHAYVRSRVSELDPTQRYLVTSHDAFGYFGRAYGFEVKGLQGLSTATEAGTADVQELADYVAERRIPALFIESSVSPRGIEAVQAAVRARGFEVRIGGTLYGDALGPVGTSADTYVGMVRSNIDTIVNGLLGQAP
ncbi:MAG: zinc ABC transporter substrate-binding protein [Rhodothermales bacterium]|nr:zinc ABC transporter substrate-binding protein [Rhodothermales bacterium]MBO6780297.1 zinc ABC transporter substrate-binding protein [Rhodothermales bacterium]